ncbi:MAG: hypothetical protein MK133_14980, partial [Planctomycetes bacterium]|nr:hypothetical protein [Planctomycetota bacterium]
GRLCSLGFAVIVGAGRAFFEVEALQLASGDASKVNFFSKMLEDGLRRGFSAGEDIEGDLSQVRVGMS